MIIGQFPCPIIKMQNTKEETGMTVLKFNIETMKKLANKDRYIRFVFNDLKNRNANIPNKEILEIIFNTNVLEDAAIQEKYLQLSM